MPSTNHPFPQYPPARLAVTLDSECVIVPYQQRTATYKMPLSIRRINLFIIGYNYNPLHLIPFLIDVSIYSELFSSLLRYF